MDAVDRPAALGTALDERLEQPADALIILRVAKRRHGVEADHRPRMEHQAADERRRQPVIGVDLAREVAERNELFAVRRDHRREVDVALARLRVRRITRAE